MESPKRGCDLVGTCVLKRDAFKKRIAITFCDLKTSLGARAYVQVALRSKSAAFLRLRS